MKRLPGRTKRQSQSPWLFLPVVFITSTFRLSSAARLRPGSSLDWLRRRAKPAPSLLKFENQSIDSVDVSDLDNALAEHQDKLSKRCADTNGFVDEWGGKLPNWMGSCREWLRRDCTQAVEVYNYTQAGEDEILANCKLSCKTCTPGDNVTVRILVDSSPDAQGSGKMRMKLGADGEWVEVDMPTEKGEWATYEMPSSLSSNSQITIAAENFDGLLIDKINVGGSNVFQGLPMWLDNPCQGEYGDISCASEATWHFALADTARPEHWWQPTSYSRDRCMDARIEYKRPETTDRMGMTASKCFAACSLKRGERFFGIANGDTCWCADDLTAKEVSANSCDRPCPGDQASQCGGTGAISNVYIMIDCAQNTPDEKLEIAEEKEDRVLTSYTTLGGQTCGESVDNKALINDEATMVAAPEECQIACWSGQGSAGCHGFTYDWTLSKCTFHFDVLAGPTTRDEDKTCYLKKLGLL